MLSLFLLLRAFIYKKETICALKSHKSFCIMKKRPFITERVKMASIFKKNYREMNKRGILWLQNIL